MQYADGKKKKNIIWGVIISYVNVLISILYGFISVPVLLNALGKSEYGVYSTIASMIGYMSIMDFGIHNVLVRYLTKYRVQEDRKAYENLLATAFIIYGAISAILFAAGMVLFVNIPTMFAGTFSSGEIHIAKTIFWVVLADLVISLPGAVFQCVINAEEHFIFGRTTLGIKQLLKLAMVILVARAGGRSLAFVLSVFGLNMAVIAVQAVYAYRVLDMRIRLYSWSWGYISSLFVYTSYVFIASVADQILWKLDSVVLGMRVSAVTVAVYAVAMNLVTIYRKFSGAVSGIFLPRATEMSITDSAPEASVRLMTRVGIMQYSILSLILAGFALVGKEFLFVWLGEGYDEVYIIFLILCTALLVPNCQSIGINILEARNRHRFRDHGCDQIVISALGAVLIHRCQKDLSAAQAHNFARPLQRIEPGGLCAAGYNDFVSRRKLLFFPLATLNVDSHNYALRSEAFTCFLHEKGILHSRGIKRHLVSSGIKYRSYVIDGSDSAADRERYKNLVSHASDHINNSISGFQSCCDIKEHQFVGSLFRIGLAQFYRIACRAQIDEVSTFHGLSVLHIQTRYYAFCQSHSSFRLILPS